MTIHIAFVAPPELHRNAVKLIENIDARSNASQADLMTSIINDFTDATLKVFFIDMIELLDPSPFMEKMVTGSVNTIKSTIHSVSRTVIHKLDNKQLIPLSDYISRIMLTTADAEGLEKVFIGFPITETTYRRMQKIVADMNGSDPHAHIGELMDMLHEITDLALDSYLITPVDLLQLGFFLRKLAEGAVAIVRGAVHLVIRRLVPELTPRHLQALTQYLHDLVLLNGRPWC